MERVRRSCDFPNGIDVDSIGCRGGLCLAWRGDVTIMLQSFSKRHINVVIEDLDNSKKLRYTSFYGTPYVQDRHESWDLLKNLRSTIGFHGLFVGILTKLCMTLKKMEVYLEMRDEWKYFAQCWKIVICWMWEKGNLLKTNIQERLDRGVSTEECISMFPEALIQHLPHSFSDHCPLLITTKREEKWWPRKSFKFEAWWVLEESLTNKDTLTGDLLQKLESIRKGLERWANRIRRSRKEKNEFLTSRLIELMEIERDDENLAELIDTKIQLNFEIEKDERYWEQRARYKDGRETEVVQEMEVIARSYFQNLSLVGERGNYEHLLSGIDHCVFYEDNCRLTARYTKEIRMA
ncbi:reverse transcriptase [Gossypium australe]|uniref:Reverse transcriptase n=1 Tax=Gossypium australe TaxID=47621 RepID=A0A5B6WFK2_9ROSI|nr:reverse transcriptase [Gossypium australe]